MSATKTSIPHGRYTRYTKCGCRCGPCTAAQREFMRKWRRRNDKRPELEVPHGVNGYENYGCRCDVCEEAKCRKAAAWYLAKADALAAGRAS